jgi:hypothetical protein
MERQARIAPDVAMFDAGRPPYLTSSTPAGTSWGQSIAA